MMLRSRVFFVFLLGSTTVCTLLFACWEKGHVVLFKRAVGGASGAVPREGSANGREQKSHVWPRGEFESLKDMDVFIGNAYMDDREGEPSVVRVWLLGRLEFQGDVFCHLAQPVRTRKRWKKGLRVVKGIVTMQESNVAPFCLYYTGVLDCPCPPGFLPTQVSISSQPNTTTNHWHTVAMAIPHTPKQPTTSSGLAICLKTLYDQGSDHLRPLIEWFELHRLLGVESVFLYGTRNVTDDVVRLLRHYESQGFLTMEPWSIPIETLTKNIYKQPLSPSLSQTLRDHSHYPCVRHFAQHLAHMDCLYSRMATHPLLALIDTDEFLVPSADAVSSKVNTTKRSLKVTPKVNATIKDALLRLQTLYPKAASFVFDEACFLPDNSAPLLTGSYLRGKITPNHNAGKSVLLAQRVKNFHIHRVSAKEPALRGFQSFLFADTGVMKLHHYKQAKRCQPYLWEDTSAARFQGALQEAVRATWDALHKGNSR